MTRPEKSTPLEYLNLFFGVEKGDGAACEAAASFVGDAEADVDDDAVEGAVERADVRREGEGAIASAGWDANSSLARLRADRKCAGDTEAAF